MHCDLSTVDVGVSVDVGVDVVVVVDAYAVSLFEPIVNLIHLPMS